MHKTAEQVFKTLQGKKREDLHAVFAFDIKGHGHWRLYVKNGRVKVDHSKKKADFTLATTESDFEKIVEGKQNLLTAIMQGRVKYKGDIITGQKLNATLRSNLRKTRKEK